MDLFRSAQAVAGSQGDGIVDWTAVAAAAKAATPSGDLDLSTEEQQGYRTDVREARDRLRSVGEVEFDLPETIEIQNRHHWIDANIATFRRVVEPFRRAVDDVPRRFPCGEHRHDGCHSRFSRPQRHGPVRPAVARRH